MLFGSLMSVEEHVTGRKLEMQNVVPSYIEVGQRSAGKRRPWSSSSQTYVPADVLLEYLADGWGISPVVSRKEFWRGGGRHISVYYFELTRNDQMVVMPVLSNPIVRRLISQQQFRIVLLTCDEVRLLEEAVAAA